MPGVVAIGLYIARLMAVSIAVFAHQTVASADDKGTQHAVAPLLEAGRRIYEDGVLQSGGPLIAERGDGLGSRGKSAACINCHRRSGYGAQEGSIVVPPITGPSLFANARLAGGKPRRSSGIDYREPSFRSRPVYDDALLARALREGISPSNQRLQFLMPRYRLADTDFSALSAYLRHLSSGEPEGVEDGHVRFATVIAGNQPAERQQAFVDVLHACFADRQPDAKPADRIWQLDEWRLVGPAADWDQQLAEHYAKRPVLALVSGLGADWTAVHRFCESRQIPCLFPNVDAPGAETDGVYTFYFSKGVVLEAAVLARYIFAEAKSRTFSRIVQLVGASASAAKAAAALRSSVDGSIFAIEDEAFTPARSAALRLRLASLSARDVLVMWLDREEVATLDAITAPSAGLSLLSGWLGGLEATPLPPAWKRIVELVYPFDAPQRWNARMAYNLRPWLAGHGIPATDQRLLGNTLAACNIVSESIARMRGALNRDFLVETIESYPAGMGNAPAPQAYPRFSIGPGQRTTSNGAYIVRFKAPEFQDLEPVRDWVIP